MYEDMKQYIDKSTLVAEIKKRIKEREEEEKKGWAYSRVKIVECEHILSFIDTLEVKEVQEEPVIVDTPPYDYVKGFSDGRLYEKRQKEKSVSEDLEEEIKHFTMSEELYESNSVIKAVAHHFSNWQKKQDKETIELAEDHAMLAGIIKGTEHTIGNVRSILNKVAYKNNGLDVNGDYCEQPYVELDNEFRKLLKKD